MSYNPVIRGFNAVGKLIVRGYAQLKASGEKVKICRLWTQPYVCMALSDNPFMSLKVSAENYIDLKASDSPFILQRLFTKKHVDMKVSDQ